MHSLNAGIVDEAIHGSEFFGHLFRRALKRQSVGDIEGIGFDTRVGLADFPKGFDAPSRYYDSCALASERHCKTSADSGAATGYEAAFAGKCHGFLLTEYDMASQPVFVTKGSERVILQRTSEENSPRFEPTTKPMTRVVSRV